MTAPNDKPVNTETPEVDPVEPVVETPVEEPPVEPPVETPKEAPDGEKPKEENPEELKNLMDDPEVKALVEKYRQEEKDKLYKTIEKKDKKIEELELQVKNLTEQLTKEGRTAEAQIADLTTKLETLSGEVSDLKEENHKKDLTLYKERRLQEADGELIIDLVSGDSEEAIDASIETAKQRYREIAEQVTSGKPKNEPKPEVPKPTNPPQPHGAKQLTPDEIQRMTPEEWAKHRDEVKRSMGLRK